MTLKSAASFSSCRLIPCSIVWYADSVAPAAVSIVASASENASVPRPVRTSAPAPASTDPKRSLIPTFAAPACFSRSCRASCTVPPPAMNSRNDCPASDLNSSEVLPPSFESSTNICRSWVVATPAGTPCAVIAAIAAPTSPNEIPSACAVGTTL